MGGWKHDDSRACHFLSTYTFPCSYLLPVSSIPKRLTLQKIMRGCRYQLSCQQNVQATGRNMRTAKWGREESEGNYGGRRFKRHSSVIHTAVSQWPIIKCLRETTVSYYNTNLGGELNRLTNTCTHLVFYLLKLIWNFLKHSYMFRSFDHHQGVFSSLLKSL